MWAGVKASRDGVVLVCCCFCIIFMVSVLVIFFFFNDTATTEIYTLSLHDALPIYLLCIKLEHVHVGLTSGEVGTSSTLVYHFYVEKIRLSWFQLDRKSTRLNSSHVKRSRMPSSA